MQEKLVIRAKIARAAREYLDHNEFLEIETPILTKSTLAAPVTILFLQDYTPEVFMLFHNHHKFINNY